MDPRAMKLCIISMQDAGVDIALVRSQDVEKTYLEDLMGILPYIWILKAMIACVDATDIHSCRPYGYRTRGYYFRAFR